MIYYEYLFDDNNFIAGWKSWNPERNIKDNTENSEYQAKMELIKDNPAPTGEMNAAYQNQGRLYNRSTNNNYKIENNEIVTVQYVKTSNELFEEKYTLNKVIGILANGIINPSDSELQELKEDLTGINISKLKGVK